LAEHKFASHAGNIHYPKHFLDHEDSDTSSLQVFGINNITRSIKKGDRQSKLNQRETLWIFKLQSTKYPGLNEEFDFTIFSLTVITLVWYHIAFLLTNFYISCNQMFNLFLTNFVGQMMPSPVALKHSFF